MAVAAEPALMCKNGGDLGGKPVDLSAIQVIASDMDGTFLNQDHEAPEENLSALAEAEAAGFRVFLATGRNRKSAQEKLTSIDLCRRPGVYLNGAVVHGSDGTVIHERVIPSDVVVDVTRFVKENVADKCTVVLCRGDEHAVVDKEHKFGLHLHDIYQDPYPEDLQGHDATIAAFGGAAEEDQDKPTKKARRAEPHLVHVVGASADLDAVLEPFRALCGERAKVVRGLPTCVTLLHPLCSKADGLAAMLKLLGSSLDVTLAMGDQGNDLEMLREARIGVAMGNAPPEIKEGADYVCAGNHEQPHGVSRVLREVVRQARERREATKA